MKDLELKRNAEWYSDPTAYHGILNALKGEKNMMTYAKGDIYYCSTKNGNNVPVLIVSDKEQNGYVLVAAISKMESMDDDPYSCEIMTRIPSAVHLMNVRSVAVDDLVEFMRSCSGEEMEKVNHCLRLAFGLGVMKPALKQPKVDEMSFLLKQTEAEYKAELAEKDKAIAELTSLYEKELIAQKDVPMLIAERDVYKKMYQELLERMIAR